MDTIFIKKLLKELKEEQKYELFKYLIEYDDTIYTKILEWVKKNEIIKDSDNECEVLFATVQSLDKSEYLNSEYFEKDYFDYIIIDGAVIIGLN